MAKCLANNTIMTNKPFLTLFFLILFSTLTNQLIAQNNGTSKLKFPPKALLVQLSTESRKIANCLSVGDTNTANRIRKEAWQIRKVTANDFSSNFSFCPVYYFLDTNAEKIKNQYFDGVLLNSDGSLAHDIVLQPGDSNYFIIYYGHPNNQGYDGAWTGMSNGLIFLNYQYNQVDYFHVFRYASIFRRQSEDFYESKKYDMEYYPFAALYDNLLNKKFRSAKN
jgi:hypothetical protein